MNLVIFSLAPVGHHEALTSQGLVQVANAAHNYTGGVASIYILFFAIGASIVGRSLPFALTLGVSRRSYYAGSAALGVALAVTDGLVLAALQAVERSTDGWGAHMHFFQVPYVLAGPWYLTWLTSFGGAGPAVRVRDVVRDRLPALEPDRRGCLHRRPAHGRARRGAA